MLLTKIQFAFSTNLLTAYIFSFIYSKKFQKGITEALMQALDTLKRKMYVHINCTFQDSVGPGLIYSTRRQRERKPWRVSHGDKQTRALALRKAPRQLLSPRCLPFLAQLGLGASSFMALKTRLSKTQARTSEIPHSATGRALVVV